MNLDDRVLLVDKPPGLTSFAVVRQVRRAARVDKAGHCGSLDPLATGLVVVCTGMATRAASVFVDRTKEYTGRVRFGRATDSYDADGRTTHAAVVTGLDAARVRGALQRFVGEIEQTPPMVSALKVGGRRLYELARQGTEIERAPRRVRVDAIDLVDCGEDWVDLRVRCGRGCYVRSIAHDLGIVLGVPAHLQSLRRLAIGSLRVENAIAPAAFEAERDAASARSALSLWRALEFLPEVRVRRPFEDRTRNGGAPWPHELLRAADAPGRVRLASEDGRWFLAIGQVASRNEPVALEVVFARPVPAEVEAPRH